MAKKKSAAQIRRMQERAKQRGEEYEYVPPPASEDPVEEGNNNSSAGGDDMNNCSTNKNSEEPENNSVEDVSKLKSAAVKLKRELEAIDADEAMKSKDRRSAKRKAEAISNEESGMPAQELLAWYDKHMASSSNKVGNEASSRVDPKLQKAASKLVKELKAIEDDQDMKSKDRRSAKRKAEAIATEESGMAAEELIEWYNKIGSASKNKATSDKHVDGERRHKNPYIAFIGQMSYDTTKESLFQHIQSELGKEFEITQQNIRIRILTDSKTKKSRGMGFVEVDDPETLYGLLKLHHTHLEGRRINVERSAGGKKDSEARKAKITQYRKEQEEYVSEVVDKIFQEYKSTGELREGELDDGVVALCKRHAAPIVQAALAKYIEGAGRDMDNPSAYLTFLITKFAMEGVYEERDAENTKDGSTSQKRRKIESKKSTEGTSSSSSSSPEKKSFLQRGVDMPLSKAKGGDTSKIFPSSTRGGRGRGRAGRGYMRG